MEINYDELKQIGIFEYVALHYWEMNKEQLATFAKEISYSALTFCESEYGLKKGKNVYKEQVEKDAIEEIIEREMYE